MYLGKDHPLFSHVKRESLKLVYTPETLVCLKVEGKKRKGAPRVQSKTVFASIFLDDGTEYKLEAALKGFVVEINEKAMEDPKMLLEKEDDRTYLIILQPKSEYHTLNDFK